MFRYKVLLILLLPLVLYGQNNSVLENYIDDALAGNLALEQKEFDLRKSLAAIDEARANFFPSVNIEARYSRADGGRTIDIPIGDLMNPIHNTLNALTGTANFPGNLPNESIAFLREKEHDTKLRVTQPVFRPEILFNYNLKKEQAKAERAQKRKYARELVAEVKKAYFDYLSADKAEELYRESLTIVKENLSVQRSLVKNEKATADAVYNAEAELSGIEGDVLEAENKTKLAAAYFNFLLNRPLETEIISAEFENIPEAAGEENLYASVSNREELTALEAALNAAGKGVQINKTGYYPGVNFVFDYGYQGEKYKFDNEHDYWMASLLFSWNLFRGFGDKAKVEQAELNRKTYRARLDEVKKQLNLEVKRDLYNFRTAVKKTETAAKRAQSAEKAFRITESRYKGGAAIYLEYSDARNRYTRAGIENVLARYGALKAWADLEKAAALYPVKEKLNINGEK